MCTFDIDSSRCTSCINFADCLDEELDEELTFAERVSRDGPLKVIVDWNRTCRDRAAFMGGSTVRRANAYR